MNQFPLEYIPKLTWVIVLLIVILIIMRNTEYEIIVNDGKVKIPPKNIKTKDSRINNLLLPFKDLIISFSNFSKNNDAYSSASHIASNSGLLKDLWDDRSIEGISRFENVQELLNSIKEFVDYDENKENLWVEIVGKLSGDDVSEDLKRLIYVQKIGGLILYYLF